jgi:putative heme transporter
VLTWVAAFFPIIGAVTAGIAAVLVALVSQGVGAAIAIAVVILLVQQLEGNVLYPAVVGPRLRLHPVSVLLAVTIGATLAGIPGAFLAVPVATVIAVVVGDKRARRADIPELELALT